MADMNPPSRLKKAVQRAGKGAGKGAEIARLEERIADLEEEVSECRRYHQRTAELTDLVESLLIPLATRDEAELQRLLREYSDQLG